MLAKLRAWRAMLATDPADSAPLIRSEVDAIGLDAKYSAKICEGIEETKRLVSPVALVSGSN